MKNITSFMNIVKCSKCDKNGFFIVENYNSSDVTYECPCCKDINYNYVSDEYINVCFCDKCDGLIKLDNLEAECKCPHCYTEIQVEKITTAHLCLKCLIVFKKGDIHYKDNKNKIINSKFIRKWMYLPDGSIHIGMPKFETEDEFFSEIENIKVLEFVTPNNHWICEKQDSNENK